MAYYLHALQPIWKPLLHCIHHLLVGHHLGVRPYIPIKGHVLNEAYIDSTIPGELHKVTDFIVIDAPHDNNIDLQIIATFRIEQANQGNTNQL